MKLFCASRASRPTAHPLTGPVAPAQHEPAARCCQAARQAEARLPAACHRSTGRAAPPSPPGHRRPARRAAALPARPARPGPTPCRPIVARGRSRASAASITPSATGVVSPTEVAVPGAASVASDPAASATWNAAPGCAGLAAPRRAGPVARKRAASMMVMHPAPFSTPSVPSGRSCRGGLRPNPGKPADSPLARRLPYRSQIDRSSLTDPLPWLAHYRCRPRTEA
jgi:hypothetical protein